MTRARTFRAATFFLFAAAACGARTALLEGRGASSSASVSASSSSRSSSSSGTGGASCVPTEEECNGVDDNCNGEIDESDPNEGMPCDTGQLGVCATGALVCVNGGLLCKPTNQPSPEVCNGLDDDCDGVIDNDVDCTKRVFVTSQLYTGALGGLAGGDAKCQALADAAGLGGTYKAWLSDRSTNAADRLTHVGAPYVLADGVTVVVKDWAALVAVSITQPLQHPINMTETMQPAPISSFMQRAVIWTSTNAKGEVAQPAACDAQDCDDCNAWNGEAAAGQFGDTTAINDNWTYCPCTGDFDAVCSFAMALACFEQ